MSGNHTEPDNAVHTGTTTLALKCKDGVVMATDQRATMGNLIANSNVQKVYPISDYIGMTISGLVGDAQLMIRFMKSEIAIYEMEKGARISVQTAATMLGSVIRQGFYLGPLVAGVDKTGGHVFSVDGAGGVLEDEYSGDSISKSRELRSNENNHKRSSRIREVDRLQQADGETGPRVRHLRKDIPPACCRKKPFIG